MKNVTLTPRAATAILLASLALNLFLLTWAGVGLFKQETRRPWLSLESVEERYAARLSGNDAAAFRRALEAHRAELSARIEASRNSRATVRQALQAEPFERARLEAAFADSRQAMTAFQQALQSLLLDAAGELSADGRRRLSEHAQHSESKAAQPTPADAARHEPSER